MALVLVAVILQFSYLGPQGMDSAHGRHDFLEQMGHKLNSEAVVGVSLERVVRCAECMEGSGKGEQAWAGATLRHCPKIISFCNPVHFFLGTIQYFFLSGFSCLTMLRIEFVCSPELWN